MPRMPSHKYPELARRLAAATGSYTTRVKSMDYYMREYVSGEVGQYWHELAEQIMEETAKSQARRVLVDLPEPPKRIQ